MAGAMLDLDQATAELAARFDVVDERLALAGRDYRVLHPRSADDLLDEEEFERDERIPYWAEVWPSARVLAEIVASETGSGRRLLELGCGAGFVALAGLSAGFDVLATDYYEDALLFTKLNARRNGLAEPQTACVDWRHYPDSLRGFDLVVAADVLYEKPYAGLIATVMSQSLGEAGLGIVADPGRQRARDFPAACRQRGLNAELAVQTPWHQGDTRVTIDVYHVRR